LAQHHPRPADEPRAHRRAHLLISVALFAGLGFHVGVWTVLLADLAVALDLGPGTLGAALAAVAVAGIVALLVGGAVTDRFGRRWLAVGGGVGLGLTFALLAVVGSLPALVAVLLLFGVASGLLDLAANAVGSDYERRHGALVMTQLHAGFSAAAALGALGAAIALDAGVGFRAIFAVTAVGLIALGLASLRAALPETRAPARPGNDARGALRFVVRLPGVLLATGIVTVCFFGDGALESYSSLYLREGIGSGALLAGAGIAAFHVASFGARLASAPLIRMLGESRVLVLAGLGAAAGIVVALATTTAAVAAFGLLLVGFSLAPVVPIAISVAGRSAPGRAGAAVSVVTTVGYGAIILAPPAIGLLAQATSLRAALVPLVGTTLLIALLGRRVARLA